MKSKPLITKINIVLDCSNANDLAAFYNKLLGWKSTHLNINGWASITSPTGTIMAFQEIENYNPPVWPTEKDKQAQMMHLDFVVDNLDEAVQFAIECGATIASVQYFESSMTMIDPAGHTFCLDTNENQ